MSAALIQGARGATEDIDLWFESLADPRIGEAVRAAGGLMALGSWREMSRRGWRRQVRFGVTAAVRREHWRFAPHPATLGAWEIGGTAHVRA